MELYQRRLRHRKLAGSDLRTPEAVVAWLGALQPQDCIQPRRRGPVFRRRVSAGW